MNDLLRQSPIFSSTRLRAKRRFRTWVKARKAQETHLSTVHSAGILYRTLLLSLFETGS